MKHKIITATRTVLALVTLGLAGWGSPTQATELEATLSAGSAPFGIGLSLRDLALSDDLKVEFGVSDRAVQAGLAYALDFGPAGRVGSSLRLSYVYSPKLEGNVMPSPGIRLRLGLRGTLAQVALDASLAYWNVPADASNPLVVFEREPELLTNPNDKSGYSLQASAAYRLSRILTLNAAARNSSEGSRLELGLAGKAAGSEFAYSGGALVAFQSDGNSYFGTFGLKYVPEEQPYSLNAGLMLGVAGKGNFSYGLNVGLDADLPDELGKLGAYFVLEPWRLDAYPLRFGLGIELNAGPGVLFSKVQGGSSLGGIVPWGVQLGYRLSLDDLLKP